jgi:N-acetylneuraminic acid mutarotase
MKWLLSIVISSILLFEGNAQDVWIPRDSVNGPGKSACTAFSIGLRGYIGFGLADDGYKRSLYAYDPIEDDWDKMESLGGLTGGGLERVLPVSFVVDQKAYVGLGNGNNPYYKDFWEYDPATNSWTQKADYAGTARRQAVAFAIDSLGYVGTGYDANGYKADFWSYNPTTNIWSAIADFGGGVRKQAVGFALGDKGYVGTGDDGGFTKDFWAYNPQTDVWIQKADFPGSPRYAATAVAAYPDAIVGLGLDNSLGYAADMYRYDAPSDTWVQLADFLGGARSNAVGFVIQQHAYVGCGYSSTGAYLDDFYEYGNLIQVDKLASERADFSLQLYPHPVSSHCSIKVTSALPASLLQLEIYNTQGALVTDRFDVRVNSEGWNLQVGDLPNGLYVYEIKMQQASLKSGKISIAK